MMTFVRSSATNIPQNETNETWAPSVVSGATSEADWNDSPVAWLAVVLMVHFAETPTP